LEPSFWRDRWAAGVIGFHRGELHPDLVDHHERFTKDGGRVLVPLCGKSVDVPWLARQHDTVAVELSEVAVQALHQEHGLDTTPEAGGPFQVWQSPRLTVLQGDVFDLGPQHVQGVDRVWDRAALVALMPAQRARYVAHLRTLLPRGARILLNVLVYDPQVMSGPPHSVDEAEVRALYDGADVELLDRKDAMNPRWAERGHAWFRRDLYLITL